MSARRPLASSRATSTTPPTSTRATRPRYCAFVLCYFGTTREGQDRERENADHPLPKSEFLSPSRRERPPPPLLLLTRDKKKMRPFTPRPPKIRMQVFRIQRCTRHHCGVLGRPDASDARPGRFLGQLERREHKGQALARSVRRRDDGALCCHQDRAIHGPCGALRSLRFVAVLALCPGQAGTQLEVRRKRDLEGEKKEEKEKEKIS